MHWVTESTADSIYSSGSVKPKYVFIIHIIYLSIISKMVLCDPAFFFSY